MSTYDRDGTLILSQYDIIGDILLQAYDIAGNELIPVDGFTLKVMQYNVGQWYVGDHDNVPANEDETYYNLQSGMIENADADILFLEEYTAQFSKAGRTSVSMLSNAYPYYHEQTNGTTTTVTQRAIFSKYPISNYQTHTLHDGYYYDTCTVTVHNKQIHLVVTHFHWSNVSYRSAEADTVLADIENYDYTILGGDLNTADNFDTSGVGYTTVVKKFIDAGYNVANGGRFGFLRTYGGSTVLDSCLDNVIASSNILINSVTIDQTKVNDSIVAKVDHVPMIAVLTVT